MSMSLPIGLILGCLKNEVVELKHREAKSLHTVQGVRRGGPYAEIQGVCICTLHV